MLKTCFLFGHADACDDILPNLLQAVEDAYATQGVTEFYVGNRGRFDSLAATAVKRVKKQHADIHLYLLLAYHPAQRPVIPWDGFDGSYYPPLMKVPLPFAIVRANQYMIDTSDLIICYVKHVGNSRNLLAYARKRKKADECIINIDDMQGTV